MINLVNLKSLNPSVRDYVADYVEEKLDSNFRNGFEYDPRSFIYFYRVRENDLEELKGKSLLNGTFSNLVVLSSGRLIP